MERSGRRMESVRNVLKVSELNKSVKEQAYQESFRGKYIKSCGCPESGLRSEVV